MATQNKIRIFKREAKKGITYSYSLEAGRNPKTGKRQRVTKSGFKTQKEARAAAQVILNKMLLGQNIVESHILFNEYADEWYVQYSKHLKKTSLPTLKANLNTAKKYLGYKKLKSITPYDYQEFINDFSVGRTKRSVERVHVVIKSMFKSAILYNLITTNPAEKVIFPKFEYKKIDIESLYLSKEELQAFLDYASTYKGYGSDYFYTMCMVLAYTGIRLGEACSLLWENIDFKNKFISIESSMYGKNYNDYERQSTPKNLSSIRKIIIGDKLVCQLKAWKHEQLRLRVLHGTQDRRDKLNFVFTRYLKSQNIEKPVLQSVFQMALLKINKKHLFKKNIHAHLFRHTHASLLAEAGVNLEAIQERLGHHSDKTTKQIYLHITKKVKTIAANKFENYMR